METEQPRENLPRQFAVSSRYHKTYADNAPKMWWDILDSGGDHWSTGTKDSRQLPFTLLIVIAVSTALALIFIIVVWVKTGMSREDKKASESGDAESGSKSERGGTACTGPASASPIVASDQLQEQTWICHPVIRPEVVPSEITSQPIGEKLMPNLTETVGVASAIPKHRLKAGLLERRGSTASLTIDLTSTTSTYRPAQELPTHVAEPPPATPSSDRCNEDFLRSVSGPLNRQQLRGCLRDVRALHRQFWDLPANHPEGIQVAGSWVKNRYRTVIPNENTRVHLPVEQGSLEGSADYINANYISGYNGEPRAFIATQGPLSNTVSDFWLMTWQEKCPVIVMITKLWEKSKSKCEQYLPDEVGSAVQYGNILVTVTNKENKDGFIISNITMQKDEESRKVVHFWYDSWPDHKTPANAHSLLSLAKQVDNARFEGSTGRRPSYVWLSSPPSLKDTTSPVLTFGSLELRHDLVESPVTAKSSHESSPSKKKTKQSDDYDKSPPTDEQLFRSPMCPSASSSAGFELGTVFKFGSPRLLPDRSRSEDSAFDFDISPAPPASADIIDRQIYCKFERLSTNSTSSYDTATAMSPATWSLGKSSKFSVDSLPNYTAESSPNLITSGEFGKEEVQDFSGEPVAGSHSGGQTLTVPPLDLSLAGHHSLDSPRWTDAACSSPRASPTGPVIVHCSAGIGRTGCFIAICIGITQLLAENTVDIVGIVAKMRCDRGGMVQTAEQFEFIHRALALFERSLPDQSGE
ncbi:hypothetical protein O3M35_009330 [Rhynocoris fuscipes]|uniref:protein-tyrosine-phosphatase n=1 Tax=Rhynocoris fuscipes TaxID=488301 RepID=A0AAW1D2J2_9HEMI